MVANVTPFLFLGSQTVVREHRGDVPSRADVLSGVTPFTITGSGSVYRSEDTGTDSRRLVLYSVIYNSTRNSENTTGLVSFLLD